MVWYWRWSSFHPWRFDVLLHSIPIDSNWIPNKFPIDFIFKEEDAQGRLKVCVLDNKGPEARRYNKRTPFIFYAIDKIFSRDDYEQKRKTMLTRNKFFKCSQTEFRVRLTRFPQCFLLVELSKSRKEWFWQHFKDFINFGY